MSQIQEIVADFEAARRRLHELARATSDERWATRADPERWSVAECVAHLNLTAEAFLPPMRRALEEARAIGGPAPARYRRDPLGWLLWKIMPPPARVARVKTSAAFVPTGALGREALVAEFDRLQGEQVALAAAADGLPLGRVFIASPFDARARYNLFSCLSILPRHQHRHLWQAERVWARAS
jgi:hypothetical protein